MPTAGGAPSFRRARRDDVPAIVRLLADDPLGRDREAPSPEPPAAYWRAFDAVDRDGRNLLVVAELDGEVVATLQLTTDKRRPGALRFYESLGFRATHEGLKLPLDPAR